MDMPLPASDRSLPTLRAGGKTLDATPNRMGWLRPSDPAEPLTTLLARFRHDGYLFLKGFLGRDEVLEQRRRALVHLGLTEPGTDPGLGVVAKQLPDAGTVNRRLMEYVRSAAFESFCMTPRLWQFMDGVVGGLSYLTSASCCATRCPGRPRRRRRTTTWSICAAAPTGWSRRGFRLATAPRRWAVWSISSIRTLLV